MTEIKIKIDPSIAIEHLTDKGKRKPRPKSEGRIFEEVTDLLPGLRLVIRVPDSAKKRPLKPRKDTD